MGRKFLLFCIATLLVTAVAVPASQAEPVKIRFGILNVLDTLPLQVAAQDGLFEAEGLDVELVSFASALERDVAIQAGHLDGYFGDLIAAILLLQSGADMPVALVSYRTTPGQPMFGVALSPDAKDRDLAGLKGASIGYSKATIMEFLLDLIEEKKVTRGYFERVEVKKIPIRLQMLLSNQLDAALLPEPLLSLTAFKGGGLALTAEDLDIPLTVLCLDGTFMAGDADVFKKFIAAYTNALDALAANPENYRELMAKTCRIPPPLAPEFPIYAFPAPALPSEADVELVRAWMEAHSMLKGPIGYGEVVSPVAP